MEDDAGDLAAIRELLERVAVNRSNPVPVAAINAVRSELLALRATLGLVAWRIGVNAAISAARRDVDPLSGRVVEYVQKAARRKRTSIDPATTAAERRRVREMLEGSLGRRDDET